MNTAGHTGGTTRATWTLLACLLSATQFTTFAGTARGDELEAQGGDRVTGVIGSVDDILPVVVDLPAGATVKARVRRSGKSTLLPTIALRDPDGGDATGLLTTKSKRKGAQFDATFADVPASGRWTFDIGSAEGIGTCVLTLSVSQRKKTDAGVLVPDATTATFTFSALAGSRATFTATHKDGPAAPQFDSIDGPDGAVDIGAAKLQVKGKHTTLKAVELTATGSYQVAVALTGGGAGLVATRVKLKAPKPRHAKLTHPGPDIVIPPNQLRVTTTSLAGGTVAASYTASVAASGGTQPYSFAVTAGALPDGLALATGGGISGTPGTAGTFDFTVTVTDSASPADTAEKGLRIVVASGGGGGDEPVWAQLSPSGTAPAGRSSPGFVYDASNGRMIVALGSTGSSGFPPVFGDTGALTLGASPSWATLGTGPSQRWGPSVVYDSTRERAILYGGNVDGFQTNGEVWALDCSSASGGWSQLSPTGGTPAARLSHIAVYDSQNDRMIVFGGGSGTVPGNASTNDVWELSFASSAQGVWTERSPSGAPAVREFSAGVYDQAAHRLVLFGGMTMGTQYADTWSLDLATPGGESWTQLSPSGSAPSARDEHTAVLDTKNNRMIVFGGRIGQNDTAQAYALDLTAGSETWALLAPTGTPPAARDSHAAVYDADGERMIVFSGFTGFPSTPFEDVWELQLP